MYLLPLIFVLIGLALYGVLGGADFGAGFWELTAGRGAAAEEMRELAHDSMAPVWEANHVWLIFVLTVTWTAYPRAFGSIASTLSVALLIAGVGIILRGASYALRSGAANRREQRAIDTAFGAASVITPFALGAAVGGVAAGRVPVGNAAGNLISSWLNPVGILIGALAVVFGAYLSAVFLCGDGVRRGRVDAAERFRRRALGSAVVAGALAIGGLIVLHADAHRLFHRLVDGPGLPALIVSVLAGGTTVLLVWRRRYEPARVASALAVVAIVGGWAAAQSPRLLPGLTVRQAAAPHDTQVAVVVAVLAGGALLLPALGTLFRLALGGRLGELGTGGESTATEMGGASGPPGSRGAGAGPGTGAGVASGAGAAPGAGLTATTGELIVPRPARGALLVRLAGALLIAGFGLVNVADTGWMHVLGAACYLGFIAIAFRVALPA